MEKDNLAIISIAVALVALLIIISSISFAMFSSSGRSASVSNMLNPLASFSQPTSQAGTTIIHIGDGDGSSSDDDDDDEDTGDNPEINLGSTIYIQEGDSLVLNMDAFASDTEDSHSELEYDILSPSTSTIINAVLNSTSREVTLTAVGSAGQSVTLTIEVEDTDGNTDEDSVTVSILSGSSPNGPSITNIPDVFMLEDGTAYLPQSLDDYVTDPDNTDDEMTWTVTGNTDVNVAIDSVTRDVTFTVTPDWSGTEYITFRATDPDGNFDTNVIMVDVTAVDDSAVWNLLSSQSIDEDSASGTMVYANILTEVSDIDSPLTVNGISFVSSDIASLSFAIAGNDLLLTSISANDYGVADVTVTVNGVPATFQLNVNQLLDDCVWSDGYLEGKEICD